MAAKYSDEEIARMIAERERIALPNLRRATLIFIRLCAACSKIVDSKHPKAPKHRCLGDLIYDY
jgi:hypothetical protein